ncbi:hypothetical protein KR032_009679 [Drosophila birchii]|nr:hypothetical protein KR032_009679 [Drosophila birchii]
MESQKRPSLHLLTDATAAAAGVPGGSGGAEMSPTSGFLPDMPQWKKDLIQRRKTNVARTQAAAIASPVDGSCGALAADSSVGTAPNPNANADSAEQPTISSSSTSQKRTITTSMAAEEKSEKYFTGVHHTQGKVSVAAPLAPEAAAAAIAPIPKQRSSLLLNTTSRGSQEEDKEKEKEGGEILNLDLRERGERESQSEPAASVVALSRGEVETGTAAATTGALTNTPSSANQNPNQNHLLTKCKPGQSVAEGEPLASSSSSKTKSISISDKLQSNKFIQQQHQQQQQQHQQQLSPSKVTVNATMVAMQEMKKTTKQNGQHHRHIAGKMAAPGEDSEEHQTTTLPETLEDLKYGPGIVSKLRCRYLSLALRESRQQSNKQRLQRSTSLNTLLDREDDDGEAENEAEAAAAEGAATQVRAKSTPPPILGAKPQANKPLPQRPVSLGANGTVVGGGGGGGSVFAGNAAGTKTEEAQSNGGSGNRSRHFKRGNEVMKRARSVEALLCEKSPWNSQRISVAPPPAPVASSKVAATSTATAASPTCVTIEDKIHNARERLHSGTDTAPPKRLASIIDDTERPPPDLVKQTLKMFEASANRRPRTAHRTNGVGGVASKVASYKSINNKLSTPAPSLGFASSTPLRPTHAHPDIIPRQVTGAQDSPISTLSIMMRRIDLGDTETPDRKEATPQSEAPSETERTEGDEGDGEATADTDGDHDRIDDDDNRDHNNDGDGDSSDNNEQRDKMGAAAGDKPKPPAETITTTTGVTTAAVAGGAQQRSFASASTENAHVASGGGGSGASEVQVRKLNSSETLPTVTTKQIGVIRPLFNSQSVGSGSITSSSASSSIPLTSREIEKNRINEMKKSTATEAGAGAGAVASAGAGSSPTTSLDTVINTKEAAEETDATNASPLWALRKLRSSQSQRHGGGGVAASSSHTTENTSMVFNFSKSTKEVPDYIESDVVIFRPKRELPKPNEPGFVLLGDLSVETSTDMDFDEYSLCRPPSPCDVEFENANIVIDGKSSIRQKPKESTFRVQFNDTLTSTFEYPSEASMTIDDPPYADPFGHVSNHHKMLIAEQMLQQQLDLEQIRQLDQQPHPHQQQQQQHHHVTVDEIIELPTSTAVPGHGHGHGHGHRAGATAPGGGSMLGNLPLDYPSLGRGIILQQSPQPQPQAQQPEPAAAAAATATPKAAAGAPPPTLPTPPLPEGVEAAAPIESTIAHQRPQLPAKPQPLGLRRARPSVLLKPQYACFLQHDAAAAPPKSSSAPRKAASFTLGNHSNQQQQHHRQPKELLQPQSKYETPIRRRSRGSSSNSGESGQLQTPATDLQQLQLHQLQRRRRPSLPSSLALSNASTALLQARIPGTTLYYV